ncbi:Ser-Thr-rich glycosyl-phosphatidyl-inositol-anchored membrane family-domain-containing protein [Aspergillus multicolor]|uniref:GPI anchored serine-threonine rich family protein n=1 Tax=Aspergillus multicolor TaxID=41759 RepID=UPI003CCE2454
MRSVFFLALSAVATLVAARENAFNIPKDGYSFTAGEATTLTWDPSTEGTVTLKLQYGDVLTSSSGTTIASSIPNSGSYTWSVPSDIDDHSDYTIEIVSDSDEDATNYLPRFSIEGAEAVTTTSSTTTTTETTSTETSSTTTKTTLTTTTTTTTESTTSPTPTSTSSESPSETPASATSTESASSTSSESATDSPTSIPSVNGEDGDNAGMSNRVSGGLLALALGVAALI